MQQILAIAKQTFREAARNKILFILIFLSLIPIFCSNFVPVVGGISDKIKIVESVCLRSITFFGTLAAVLLSASSIPADIENKILSTITTKPVSRTNLIFGKIIGFIYIIGLLLLIMGSASYALIKFTDLRQETQKEKELIARKKVSHSNLQVIGESARNIGNISWIEGGGKGSSIWDFKNLPQGNNHDVFEIETKFLIESKKRFAKKIPINVKIVNPYAGEAKTETMEVQNDRLAVLRLNSKALEGSEELTVVISPKNPGDFIGVSSNSLSFFLGAKSFEYNFLKGLAIISFQFALMVIIATLGSTFLSLPVNILFCLAVFFCGNIIDFMRDLSTVIEIFGAQGHEHEQGISTIVKGPNIVILCLNYVFKKPLLVLSYILPNFKYFNVGSYFIDSINIPYKKVFTSFGYMFLYTFFCLPVSFVIFKRREIA